MITLILLASTVIGNCVAEAVDLKGRPTHMICQFKEGYYRTFKQVPEVVIVDEGTIDYQPEILMETIDRSDRQYTIEDKSDENPDIRPE